MKLTFKQWKQIETMLQCDYIAKQDEYLRERQRLEKSGVDDWTIYDNPTIKAQRLRKLYRWTVWTFQRLAKSLAKRRRFTRRVEATTKRG